MTDKMDLNEPVLLEEARSRKAASEASAALDGTIIPPDEDINFTSAESVEEGAAEVEKLIEALKKAGSSQRDKLIACAADADLWHDADGTGYATLAVQDHVEHYLLRSKGFRLWLGYRYYKAHKGAPNAQAVQDAIAALEAKARFEGEEHTPAVRVAHHDGNIYLDLADDDWQAIEITPRGWSVATFPPVRFVRPRGLRPLRAPAAHGTLDDLERFLNVRTAGDLKLVLGWLVMAFNPRGPYPVLVLNGEQGSAKSTAARLLRSIVDPNEAPTRSPPREERDLLVAARNSWVVAFDNLSGIKEWLADALCRIATGGGYSARQLYTDADEVIFEAMRPIILNGIPDLATRPDLADRAIILKLPNIDEIKCRSETEFWADFDGTAGRILAFLLDAVSTALRRREEVQLERIPRMADFCIWAEAASPAFGWKPGEFTEAYQDNRAAAIGMTVTADVVAEAILALVDEVKEWQGTASELLEKLNLRVSDQIRRSDQWPKAPNWLSNRLRRAAPGLRAMDLEVIEHPRTSGPIRWTLRSWPKKTGDTGDTVGPTDDTSDTDDNLRRYSQFAESNDGDCEERDENPQSGAEQGMGPWRERI